MFQLDFGLLRRLVLGLRGAAPATHNLSCYGNGAALRGELSLCCRAQGVLEGGFLALHCIGFRVCRIFVDEGCVNLGCPRLPTFDTVGLEAWIGSN